MESGRIQRYRLQSGRYRADAIKEIQRRHWQMAEELFWGSLVGAVKAVALSRGVDLRGDGDLKSYTASLAREARDRSIGDAFSQLASFSDMYYRDLDSRMSLVRLPLIAERVSRAVEKLWDMLPPDEEI